MSFVHSKDHVTNLDDKCIQPNAVDLRLESLEEFVDLSEAGRAMMSWSTPFHQFVTISEDGPKQFADRRPASRTLDGKDRWVVSPKSSYDLVTQHSVKIPEGMVGWCHIRSTLSRNGIILSGGLYDAGYNGVIGFTIHNLTDNVIHLDPGVRVAQFIMGASETAHLYDGYYNQNEGLSR